MRYVANAGVPRNPALLLLGATTSLCSLFSSKLAASKTLEGPAISSAHQLTRGRVDFLHARRRCMSRFIDRRRRPTEFGDSTASSWGQMKPQIYHDLPARRPS